jgi:hypothetical protein
MAKRESRTHLMQGSDPGLSSGCFEYRHVSCELQADARLARELPAPLLDKLKTSLRADQAATADVVVSLWLRRDGLSDLPDTLDMHLVMQPKLQVNIVDAAL